jgi:hypothetical protein
MNLLGHRQLMADATTGATTPTGGLGASPWIAGIGAAAGVAGGLYQYFEGKKKAAEVDKMPRPTMAGARLQEFTGLENQYKDISQQGLGAAETNEFMKRAASANYANQLNAQSMGGGSLARYVNSLNNFTMINQIGALAGQNFGRRMQGLQQYTGLLNQKQQGINQDVMMANQRLDRAGQAAAQLQQQGLANIAGGIGSGLSSLGTMYASKSTQ